MQACLVSVVSRTSSILTLEDLIFILYKWLNIDIVQHLYSFSLKCNSYIPFCLPVTVLNERLEE